MGNPIERFKTNYLSVECQQNFKSFFFFFTFTHLKYIPI